MSERSEQTQYKSPLKIVVKTSSYIIVINYASYWLICNSVANGCNVMQRDARDAVWCSVMQVMQVMQGKSSYTSYTSYASYASYTVCALQFKQQFKQLFKL